MFCYLVKFLYNTNIIQLRRIDMTNTATGYKIGKAAQLTGISTDKLRIWERRYEAVTPVRSGAGGRLYGSGDISRLKIIKMLIDNGDSISNVATLSLEELQTRVAEETHDDLILSHDEPIRIAIIGGTLPTKFSSTPNRSDDIEIVVSYEHMSSIDNKAETPNVDILVFDKSPLQEEHIQEILDLMNRFNASHTLIVYRFATQDTLNRLPKSKCSSLRAPVDVSTIKDHCRSLFARNNAAMSLFKSNLDSETTMVPARRYNDEALIKIAEISPVIKCECPHHLAELVFSLTAFEKYSSECESQNMEDAELHAYLGHATAKARHIIENALDKVIEIENIQI